MEKDNEAINIENDIETLKLTIDKIGNDQGRLQAALILVRKYLEKYHLAVVISLYHNGRLLKLMESVLENQSRDQKRDLSTIYFIYSLAYKCLFAFDQKFMKIYKELKLQKQKPDFSKSVVQSQQQNLKQQKSLIKNFNQIKTDDQIEVYEKGLRLRKYILKQLLPATPKNIFDEVTITWLKKAAFQLQSQICKQRKYSNLGLCCHLHFQNNVPYQIEGNNSFQVNIKDQSVWQSKNKNSQQQTIAEIDSIKRNIVYYLNNEGGYLYMGILTKNKQGKVEGMCGVPLKLDERKKFLKTFLREVVTKVFPTDGEHEQEDDQQQSARIRQFLKTKEDYIDASNPKNLRFQMSKSISIQFLPLYERESLMYSRSKNGVELFVIRINICQGNPAQVYYILNQRELPEAFIQSPTKPLSMIDYYNLVYQKLKNQANHKLTVKDPVSHHLCIQNLKYEPKDKLQGNDL